MFVTVLLASGALALERDQNTFGRLVRGPVSRTALLVEKGLFAVTGALPVTLLMLLAVAVFATVEWDRFHLWVAAVAVGRGGVRGARHADRRARARGAGGLAARLHPAAAARVPGAGPVRRREPRGPRLSPRRCRSCSRSTPPWMRCAPPSIGSGGLAGPLLHLAALAVAFGLASRVAIRRFG